MISKLVQDLINSITSEPHEWIYKESAEGTPPASWLTRIFAGEKKITNFLHVHLFFTEHEVTLVIHQQNITLNIEEQNALREALKINLEKLNKEASPIKDLTILEIIDGTDED